MDLNEKLTGIVQSINASVEVPGFNERKFVLEMDFSNCTIQDVITLAASPRRITWANGNRAKGEPHMATLAPVQKILVNPPGTRGVIDIEAAYLSKMSGAGLDDINTQIKALEALKTKAILRKKEV